MSVPVPLASGAGEEAVRKCRVTEGGVSLASCKMPAVSVFEIDHGKYGKQMQNKRSAATAIIVSPPEQ